VSIWFLIKSRRCQILTMNKCLNLPVHFECIQVDESAELPVEKGDRKSERGHKAII
jgi:hypothetical protein